MAKRAHWILLLAAIAAGAAYYWSKSQIPLYRADVELVYVASPEGGSSAPTPGLAGVASLLTGGNQSDGRSIALATLQSRQLLAEFIERNKLTPLLFPKLWDFEQGRWKVTADKVPSAIHAASLLRSKAMKVREDAAKGTILLTLDLPDPERVAPLANELVRMTDAQLRARSQSEGQRNLAYLQRQLSGAGNAELQQSIARLMEVQLSKQALARTGAQYAFQVIDPAVPPGEPVWPRTFLTAAVALVLALLAGCLLSALVDIRRHEDP